jgi:two-component system sensor histidine kinase DesK
MTTDCTDPLPGDDLDRSVSGMLRIRRVVIGVLVTVFLALPAVALFRHQGLSGDAAFLVPGTAVFVVLVDRWVLVRTPQPGHRQVRDLAVLWVIVVLGAALFAVGQMNWLTALAVAAAGAGRFAASWRRAVTGVAACAAVGVAVCVWHHLGYGATLAAFGVPLLGGLLAYAAERRNVLMFNLNQARAELARTAVAEERLRISRDLHDLLGHSLSLIALKSELAGRMIESDPQRAAKEIAELEAVARRSLAEVRQAVTGYRQPSLAAELAAARRMLASAGIDCRVDAPGSYDLPPEVDALLAWTVREGSTNIVRHSGAQHAGIRVTLAGASASAELTDDGAGPPAGRGTPRRRRRAARSRVTPRDPAWPGWQNGRPASAGPCRRAPAPVAGSGCGSPSRSPRPALLASSESRLRRRHRALPPASPAPSRRPGMPWRQIRTPRIPRKLPRPVPMPRTPSRPPRTPSRPPRTSSRPPRAKGAGRRTHDDRRAPDRGPGRQRGRAAAMGSRYLPGTWRCSTSKCPARSRRRAGSRATGSGRP